MISLFLLTFVPVFGVVLIAALLLSRYLGARRKTAMHSALRAEPVAGVARGAVRRPLIPLLMAPGKIAFSGFLTRVSVTRNLGMWIRQAGLSWNPGTLLWVMAGCGATGAVLGMRVHVLLSPALSSTALAIALALAPLIPVYSKRRKRLQEFERELPDALDFLARAMRAGHAFSTSLKIMADESPDPVGAEFRKVCAEYNLGAPLEAALDALMLRVPMVDLQFFSAAVTLQRQAGGNLSEVMLRLSDLIRERFALRGRVRAASAHGRLTGLVLVAMPAVIAVVLMITSSDYLRILQRDPMGKYLIAGALAGQAAGYLCIRRIVSFEV